MNLQECEPSKEIVQTCYECCLLCLVTFVSPSSVFVTCGEMSADFFFISISFSDLKNCVRNFSCMNSLNFSHHQVGS